MVYTFFFIWGEIYEYFDISKKKTNKKKKNENTNGEYKKA